MQKGSISREEYSLSNGKLAKSFYSPTNQSIRAKATQFQKTKIPAIPEPSKRYVIHFDKDEGICC